MGEINQDGFIDVLSDRINKLYESALALNQDVHEKQMRYFGNTDDVTFSKIPEILAGELVELLDRTREMVERAHKHIMEC